MQDSGEDPQWSVSQTTIFLMLIGVVLSVVLVLAITASPGH
jgi:hypothetical protein